MTEESPPDPCFLRAWQAMDMLGLMLENGRKALAEADDAKQGLGSSPTAHRLAGVLTASDLKMREIFTLLDEYGSDAIRSIKELTGVDV